MESGSSSDQEYAKVDDDVGKDDMFVDAEDELNPESRDLVLAAETAEPLKDAIVGDKIILRAENGDSESQLTDIQEERELCAREISSLWHQIKAFKYQQPFSHSNADVSTDRGYYGEETMDVSLGREAREASVQGMISDCSRSIKLALEERRHMEERIQELRAVISLRDQHIEDLNAKVSELAISQDGAASERTRDRFEKDQLVDDAASRILDSLASVVGEEEPSGEIASEKFIQVEKRTVLLIEQYHHMLYQIDCLRQCLAETCLVSVELSSQNGCSDVISAACNELIEAKRKEANLAEKMSLVEEENGRLIELLNKEEAAAKASNSELGQLKMELEQEKTRCINVKEKLSLAVTKGKSLVQQRDSLKQSMAEKTRELERCLTELDEKNRALDVADQIKEELADSEKLIVLLQENISQRNLVLVRLEEILADASLPREMQAIDIVDRCRWLVDDRASLKEISLELERLKDLLTLIEIPQSLPSSDYGARVVWLRDSFSEACKLAEKVQNEIVCTKENAQNGFDRLGGLLSIALLEKDHLQLELDDLLLEYNEVKKRENEVSQERDRLIKLLLEHSEAFMDNQLGDFEGLSLSNYPVIIERFFEKIKKQSTPEILFPKPEFLEKVQCLLYVCNLELKLCEMMFDEEMLEKSLLLTSASNELQTLSRELSLIKEEKGFLQKDLERSEEKSALLREKLSMAVKKGKGLVQDRENFKQQIEEKNAEIEHLKSQFQLLTSSFTECEKKRDWLVADLKRVEEDAISFKNWKDEIENTYMEKDKLLESLIESIDRISVVSDSVFTEPVEKIEWLIGYLSDCQKAKERFELELVKAQEESNNLACSLDEANAKLERLQDVEQKFDRVREKASEHERGLLEAKATIMTLEGTLSGFQDDIVQLSEEKRVLEVGLGHMEEGLQKATEEVSSQTRLLLEENHSKMLLEDIRSELEKEVVELTSGKEAAEKYLAEIKEEMSVQKTKLENAYQIIKSLENELLETANNLAALTIEKEAAQVSSSAAEENLVKLKGEIVDAHQTIKSLEEAMSQLKDGANHNERAAAEEEFQKFKEEANVQLSNLAEASATIKALGDASAELEKKVNILTEQNSGLEAARTDMDTALQKLQDEVALKAVELEGALAHINLLEDALEKSKSDFLVLEEEKKVHVLEIMSLDSQLNACKEELSTTNGCLESKLLELAGLINDLQATVHDDSLPLFMKETFKNKLESLRGMNSIISHLKRQFALNSELEGLPLNENDLTFTGPFPGDSGSMTNGEVEIVAANGVSLDNVASLFGSTLQGYQLRKRDLIDKYKDLSTLLDDGLAALSKKLEETRDDMLPMFEDIKSMRQNMEALKICKLEHERTIASLEENVTKLLFACSNATKTLQIDFESGLRVLSPVPDKESRSIPLVGRGESSAYDVEAFDDVIGGGKCLETVGELLSTVRNVQAMIKELECENKASSLKIQDLERKLKEAGAASEKAMKESESAHIKVSRLEAEVEALENQCDQLSLKLGEFQTDYDKLKEREADLSINKDMLSRQQGKSHVSPFPAILWEKVNNIDVEISSINLFEAADTHDDLCVHKLLYIIDGFTSLQNQLLALSHDNEELKSTIDAQVQNLRKEVQKNAAHEKGTEMLTNELNEASSSLKKVLVLLGSDELVEDQDLSGLRGLLAALEKQIMGMLSDFESSKTKAQELGAKLSEREKIVDELIAKVKLLEDLLQGRSTQPEIIQEKSISEALNLPSGSGKSEIEDSVIAPVPSAAHVRPMRKGSTDHLALSIEVESDPLISSPGADEDKGHSFKSLNTSGLVPRQGKLIADRIDGFWVSGSGVLMSRPRARLGFIAYWLLLQMWFLVTIL